jgi:hypothetical protein
VNWAKHLKVLWSKQVNPFNHNKYFLGFSLLIRVHHGDAIIDPDHGDTSIDPDHGDTTIDTDQVEGI